ncbi:peptidoglycan endopeptidase [Mycobacterium conspicuum]
MTPVTNFGSLSMLLLASLPMITIATLLALVNQVSGTPYIAGGDSPAGTDCSGLVSWVTNAATERPVFGSRFNTGNEEAALLARGFQYGTAPNALVVGWNGHHTAATLPDGTPVSSGEGGGVRIGGGGAYQPQFTHHMFLPMPEEGPGLPPPPDAPPPPPSPAILVDAPAPAPDLPPPPAPDLPPPPAPEPIGAPGIANT